MINLTFLYFFINLIVVLERMDELERIKSKNKKKSNQKSLFHRKEIDYILLTYNRKTYKRKTCKYY